MGQPETSAILNRLMDRGIVEEYVEEGEKPVRRGKTYQVTERLFNIFYLMRRGGAEALFVHDVVNFLIMAFGEDAKTALRDICDKESSVQLESDRRLIVPLRLALSQIFQSYTVTLETGGNIHSLSTETEEEFKTSSQEHSNKLVNMDNLANTLYNQGRYEEAEKLCRETLELRRNSLGQEHPGTLNSMNNLANTLYNQRRYEEAEKLYRETLELRRNSLGQEHPDTLSSMNNLANTLYNQRRYDEAEKLHRETLELRLKLLGPEHPDTLRSMYNLAITLNNQGRYEEAEKLFCETLELRRNILGQEHPDTSDSMNNLASALNNQGRYEEAEKLFRETLELRRNILGQEHPDTLSSMNNLANTLYNQRRYDEAEKLYRETLELRRNSLGQEHPDTLSSMYNLADTLYNQGRCEEAEKLLSEILKYPVYVRNNVNHLNFICIKISAVSPEKSRNIAETIEESPSKDLLYPLYAGIKLYLGEKMRLPREVREMAKIIRLRIIKEQKRLNE